MNPPSVSVWVGPKLVQLVDGTMVFNDSEEWRHECEARSILKMVDPYLWLYDLDRIRGPEAVARLRATMAEIEAAGT